VSLSRFIEGVVADVDGRFDYHLPPALQNSPLAPGVRMLAPFGRAQRVVYFLRRVSTPSIAATRPIFSLLDDVSPFSPALFEFLTWLADYYLMPWGTTLQSALPEGMKRATRPVFVLTDLGRKAFEKDNDPLIVALLQKKTFPAARARTPEARRFAAWARNGWIEAKWETPRLPQLKTAIHVTRIPGAPQPAHAPQQARVLRMLQAADEGLPLRAFDADLRAPLRRLIQKKIVSQTRVAVPPAHLTGFATPTAIVLNAAQKRVVDEMASALGGFAPFLLHGVTGSGKTEVYVRLIEAALARGFCAIFMVPEIGLTAALVSRLRQRFGETMAVLHSGLAPSARRYEWDRLREGAARLAVGVRSALFAPLQNVGVMVVDEEQDASYKQEEGGTQYHARDMTLARGKKEGAVVVLGSATPSLESFYNARTGKYRYLRLPARIDARPLPVVRAVDLRERSRWIAPFISDTLASAIQSRLDRSEQTLLLINRRGFAPALLCADCGFVPACLYCSVALTYHRDGPRLMCHHCGYDAPPPSTCSKCGGAHVTPLGIGTQQVEGQMRTLFPKASVARMDRDTVQKKEAQARTLIAFERREIDILIGTQMIAKGHDFPGVTLVGVICADLSLHLPDFRAAERTFQLLVQAAGRAGRAHLAGEVLIQTFQPEHAALVHALTHDDVGFYEDEIAARKAGEYPPFSRLTLLRIAHRDEKAAEAAAGHLAQFLKAHLPKEVTLLGPAPAPIFRLREAYRHHLLLKVPGRMPPRLSAAIKGWKAPSGARLSIHVDPQRFL